MSQEKTELWSSEDGCFADTAEFGVRDTFAGPQVFVWAGGEMDPHYMTAAEARRAADEWPAILRRMADEADARDGADRGAGSDTGLPR